MTRGEYTDSLIGFGNLATAAGLPETEQAFALMLTALTIADKNTPLGCTRETYLEMAGIVYDRLRAALSSGREAGG